MDSVIGSRYNGQINQGKELEPWTGGDTTGEEGVLLGEDTAAVSIISFHSSTVNYPKKSIYICLHSTVKYPMIG